MAGGMISLSLIPEPERPRRRHLSAGECGASS